MDKIEEEAAKVSQEATEGGPSNPVLIEPTKEELEARPMTIDTELPHSPVGPVGNTMTASSGSGTSVEPFKPEPGYIRGQLMRQAAVLSEMDAFCSQNHGYLADDALAQLKTAQNSIRAAWRSLLVAAVKLEE